MNVYLYDNDHKALVLEATNVNLVMSKLSKQWHDNAGGSDAKLEDFLDIGRFSR